MKLHLCLFILFVLMHFFVIFPASGCSDFLLKTDNSNVVISGRTIDWFDVPATISIKLLVELRNQNWTSISSVNPQKTGLSWTNKYGFLGIASNWPDIVQIPNTSGPKFLDILNEGGLSVSYLTLQVSQYPHNNPNPEKALFYLDLPAYIAGNFKTVEEAREGLKNVEVWCPSELDGKFPQHLCVHDANNHSMIVEWLKDDSGKGVMNIYDGDTVDNLHGTLTNDPAYAYQLENLELYVNSTLENHFEGLPGGFSSTDRFVRLVKFNENNEPIDLGYDFELGAVTQAFHLINSVDVIFGEYPATIDWAGEMKNVQDCTLLSMVRDHINKTYYIKTLTNQNMLKIDLNKLDFESGKYTGKLLYKPFPDTPYYTDITGDL